jgi:hypothetical protein
MEEKAQVDLGSVAAIIRVNLGTGFQFEVDSLISMLTEGETGRSSKLGLSRWYEP